MPPTRAPWGPFGGPFSNLGYVKQFLKIFEGIFEIWEYLSKKSQILGIITDTFHGVFELSIFVFFQNLFFIVCLNIFWLK